MNKTVKVVLVTGLMGITSLGGLFAYNCVEPSHNEDVLNELSGDILYTKRDDDLVLKIYKSNSNLKNEELIYEHKNTLIDNNNIIDIKYDENKDLITFVAYDDNLDNWGLFELNSNKGVTPLNKTEESAVIEDYYEEVGNDKFSIKATNGSLYMVDKETKKESLLKRYIGIYDVKFSSGYTPIKLSEDGKHLFYHYNKHNTPIGTILESYIDADNIGYIYVMNLETKETSKYVDFSDIIFIN